MMAVKAEGGMRKAEVEPKQGGLEIALWECRCHHNTYSHPSHCLHTTRDNLVPLNAAARAMEAR